MKFIFLGIFFCLAQNINSNEYRVHVFGDSHSIANFRFRKNTLKNFPITSTFNYKNFSISFFIHWLGPKTMYSIGRDGLNILNLKKYDVLENDIVVFVFGEIDVRCHIGKQRDQYMQSLGKVIKPLVSNYLNTIKQNKALYNNVKCIVLSILPPTNAILNLEFPFYGSIKDRVNITKRLNSKLQKACLSENIEFLDIFDFYANPDGTLNAALSDQTVHIGLGKNKPIKMKLLKILTKRVVSFPH